MCDSPVRLKPGRKKKSISMVDEKIKLEKDIKNYLEAKYEGEFNVSAKVVEDGFGKIVAEVPCIAPNCPRRKVWWNVTRYCHNIIWFGKIPLFHFYE